MNTTTIALTFINRRYDPRVIELVHAWDVDSVDGNPMGYEETKEQAIASIGEELLRWVTVEVEVPDQAIRESLTGELPTLQSGEPTVTQESR